MNIQGEDISSNWQKVQELGQGGFGNVCLYQNKVNEEFIAIKKLRIREEFADGTNRVWERWKQEVYIMNKLDHNSVIRAIAVPPELDNGPNDVPALGMEYCKGGDLRKLLTKPENCHGLREVFVRDLLSGIGSAIEYLHSKRIIHRDIKPENIVLQPIGDEEDRFLYKIIDLGYAKELDASSSCMLSHVGTQQYLAPELYGRQAYTRTVDYWSFGSVVFECITGKRPFLPEFTSVQWHKEVSKKSPDDITAVADEKGEVKFSKYLPGETHLCGPLKNYLEQWLKLMLRWDPKSRGGGVKKVNDVDRPKCFIVLEQILEIKLFHVMITKANLLISFPVTDRVTIESIHRAIETKTNIPVTHQLLINKDGVVLQPEQFVIDACQDSCSKNPSAHLFCQWPIPEYIIRKNKLPKPVENIVKEPDTVLSYQRQKEAWKNVVYFCAIKNFDYKQLEASERTAMKALTHTVMMIVKEKRALTDEIKRLEAFQEYFNISLDFDLRQYDSNDNLNQGINDAIHSQWLQSKQEAASIEDLSLQVTRLDNFVEEKIQRCMELQNNLTKDPKLEDCEMQAKKLYEKLRSYNERTLEHTPMVKIIGECMVCSEELTESFHDIIGKKMELFHDLRRLLPELEIKNNKIQDMKKNIIMLQRRRQEDIWKRSSDAMNVQSLNLTADTSINPLSMWDGSTPPVFHSLLNPMESVQLMDDNKTNVQLLDDLLESMEKEHDESMTYFTPKGN